MSTSKQKLATPTNLAELLARLARVQEQRRQDPVASIPFMITQAMKQRLADKGFSPTEIRAMKPDDAHVILSNAPSATEARKARQQNPEPDTSNVVHLAAATRPTFVEVASAGFGTEVIPIMPGGVKLTEGSKITLDKIGKIPGQYHGNGLWSGLGKWTERTFSDEDRAAWDTWPGPPSIALRTEKYPAVDADVTDECKTFLAKFKERIFSEFEKAPIRGRSNAERCLFLFRLATDEQPFGKTVIKFTLPGIQGEQSVEFLASGQQFVGWGQHKSGVRYTWSADPVKLGAASLPTVTLAQWQRIQEILREEIANAGGTIIKDAKTHSASSSVELPVGDNPSQWAPGFDGSEELDAAAALEKQPLWFRNVADALRAIDNSKLSREDWVAVAHASKTAVNESEDFYCLVFVDWCRDWPANVPHNPASADPARDLWDSITKTQIGWPWLRAKARANGWQDPLPEFDDAVTAKSAAITNSPPPLYMMHVKTIPLGYDVTKSPPFDWVIGYTGLAGTVTLVIGPGGAAKSTYALLRAIAIITGRPLTGEPVKKRGPVLVYNAEDAFAVLKKRVAAICKHYNIPLDDVTPHLYLASGQDQRFVVLKKVGDQIARTDAGTLICDVIAEHKIVHCVIDPLIDVSIGIKENVNEEMQELAALLRDVAQKANVSIDIVHHTPKSAAGDHGDVNAARGAGSLGAAARGAITLMPLEAKEVQRLGLQGRGRILRVELAKMNYAPLGGDPTYLQLVSVPLANACTGAESDDIMPGGDTIGVLEVVPRGEIALGKLTAAEETRKKVLSTIVNAMQTDEVKEKSLLPSIQDALGVKERQARDEIDTALPLGSEKRVTDIAGVHWLLDRQQSGSRAKAPMIIHRKRAVSERSGPQDG